MQHMLSQLMECPALSPQNYLDTCVKANYLDACQSHHKSNATCARNYDTTRAILDGAWVRSRKRAVKFFGVYFS